MTGCCHLQERIEAVPDDADLDDVYNTERHLLYVACTRARDHLLVGIRIPRGSAELKKRSSGQPGSESILCPTGLIP
jgi:ATP-dependent exoDNAse (exonuclease V) beta subunit